MKTISYIVVVVDVMNVKKKTIKREWKSASGFLENFFNIEKNPENLFWILFQIQREPKSSRVWKSFFFVVVFLCAFHSYLFFLNFGMSWDFGQKQTMRWHKKVSHQNQIKIHTKLIAQFKAHHTHIHTILTIHNSLSFDLFSYIKNSFFPLHTFIFMIND